MQTYLTLLFLISFIAFVVFLIKTIVGIVKKKSYRQSRNIAAILFAASFVFVMLVGMTAPKQEKENNVVNNTTSETAEATKQEEQTAKQENSQSESGSSAASMSMETFKSIVDMSAADNYDYYESVITEEGALSIRVANDGIAVAALATRETQNQEMLDSWNFMRDSMVNLSKQIYDSAVEAGIKDPIIFLNVLNDQNKDNTLLMVMNGIVVSDAVLDE